MLSGSIKFLGTDLVVTEYPEGDIELQQCSSVSECHPQIPQSKSFLICSDSNYSNFHLEIVSEGSGTLIFPQRQCEGYNSLVPITGISMAQLNTADERCMEILIRFWAIVSNSSRVTASLRVLSSSETFPIDIASFQVRYQINNISASVSSIRSKTVLNPTSIEMAQQAEETETTPFCNSDMTGAVFGASMCILLSPAVIIIMIAVLASCKQRKDHRSTDDAAEISETHASQEEQATENQAYSEISLPLTSLPIPTIDPAEEQEVCNLSLCPAYTMADVSCRRVDIY